MKISIDVPFGKILEDAGLMELKQFFHYGKLETTLRQQQEQSYDWVAASIAHGLERLTDLLEQGVQVVHDYYTPEEKAESPDKEQTKLFYMPGEAGRPFVVICPGGAYACVCSLKEGFTTAARLNELGYNAFVLHYRCGRGILPKPLDDLAAALRYIISNQETLQVDTSRYAVVGYSSGGHLAGEWSTENCGAPAYGLPKPDAVFLGYPASDTELFMGKGRFLLEGMLGPDFTDEDVVKYNVNANITESYPATYIWHCTDDPIVPVETAYKMVEQLKKHNRPYVFKEAAIGGHGFGLGEFTELNGWLEEAMELFEKVSKK